jgi:hypothetical protein
MKGKELLHKFMFDYALTCLKCGKALGGYSEASVSRWRAGKVEIPPAAQLLMRLVYDGKVVLFDMPGRGKG